MIDGDSARRGVDLLGALLRARNLARHDTWTRPRLLDHQRARFRRIVQHARTASPFYRDLYRGLPADASPGPGALPIVTKRLLMDHFDAVVTDPRLRRAALERHLAEARGDTAYLGRYRVVATTGTSGLRGMFVYDRDAWRTVLANTLRWQRFIGVRPRLRDRVRICTIGADDPMHVTRRVPLSGDVGLFRLLHIPATDPIAAQVAVLNAFRPNVLLPYPSIGALLAHEQIAGRLAIDPEVIATHSEILTPDMARSIERAWQRTPFNHYGLTEEPHLGTDCDRHEGIHLFEDTAMLEITDDAGHPVPDGVMGTRYLLTNLYNRTQPLIRYEVTDMLCRAAELCSCGRPFAVLSAMGGRADDMLRLPRAVGSGEVLVAPMTVTLAVEHFLGIREYAAEHDARGIDLRLVVPDAAERARIARDLPVRLAEAIGHQGAVPPPVRLTFVDRLERPARLMGKLGIVVRRRAATTAART